MTTPRIFAHRGASGLLPENTRSSFLRALDDGADGIELDVHLTADGEAVCFHDFTVDRTTDGQGAVADHTIDELRRLDATSWKLHQLPPQYSGTQIMSLTEVVNLPALTDGASVLTHVRLLLPAVGWVRRAHGLVQHH